MFQRYLLTAWRNLQKHRTNTVINIAGLAIGLCCCVLMLLFVRDEWTYDKFHTKADRIYRAFTQETVDGENVTNTVTPFPLAAALEQSIPEVEQATKIMAWNRLVRATPSTTAIGEDILFVTPAFFDIFDFPLRAGTPGALLPARNGVVLTEKMAAKYFPGENPLGQPLQIRIDSQFVDHIVTGVLADPPTNSSLQFGILLSMEYETSMVPARMLSSWYNVAPETYVLLRAGKTAAGIAPKIPGMLATALGERYDGSNYQVGFQSLTAIHLDAAMPAGMVPVSDPKYSYILGGVALLVLLIACINFTTLSIGQSVTRAREVAVRKATGAQRTQLIVQFLSETFVLASFAVSLGLLLAWAVLPIFNAVTGKQLALELGLRPALALLALVGLVSLLAGSYPALILSGLRPVAILKGQFKIGRSGRGVRTALVAVQFVFSIVLISSALIMQRQLEFLQNKKLGYNQNRLITLTFDAPAQPGLVKGITAGFDYGQPLKDQLEGLAGVDAASLIMHGFENGWTRVGYRETGTDRQRYFNLNIVDADYVKTAGMRLALGRDFQAGNTADATRGILVNEALVREYGWTNPLGQRLPGAKFADHAVIGVVEDFNFESLHTSVMPLVLSLNPALMFTGANDVTLTADAAPKLLLRLGSADLPQTIEGLRQTWKTLAPEQPFEFAFVDDRLAAQYRAESNLRKITVTASLLAVAVALFGLFGLAALSVSGRIKEIGIRKVLGATVGQIYMLVSREFLRLVAIALVLAVPLAWYLMARWLDDFAYRIEIGWMVFALAGFLTAVLTLLTVSYQAGKAALTDPVSSLRND